MDPATLTILNILLTVILTIALSVVGWLALQVISLKTEMAKLSTSVGHLADAVHELKHDYDHSYSR